VVLKILEIITSWNIEVESEKMYWNPYFKQEDEVMREYNKSCSVSDDYQAINACTKKAYLKYRDNLVQAERNARKERFKTFNKSGWRWLGIYEGYWEDWKSVTFQKEENNK